MLDLGKLVILNICDCPELEGMPALLGRSCPERIIINECGKLNCLDLGTCQNLKSVPLLSDQMTLAELKISEYPLLVKISEYPLQELSLAQMSNQEKIIIENCNNLKRVSGISDLRKLVDLSISQCGELFELCVSGLDCLERITVDSCGNLKYFELDGCKILKTVSGMEDLEELAILKICNCPEFDDLPFLCNLNCLKTSTIDGCGKLNCLGLRWCQNLKTVSGGFDLAELIIWDCPELEDFPCFASLTCLEKISIVNCGKLQNITFPATLKSLKMEDCGELYSVSGISDLTKLSKLDIYERPKLEFELRLGDMNCLESIIVDRCGKLKCLELNGCKILKSVSGMKGLKELALLEICDCPELEVVSEIFEASCLEIITIDRCEKLNSLSLRSCKNLKRVSGNLDLKALDVWECPELELSSSLARLSCLESLQIGKCEKLQSIAGIEEMNALKNMRLAYCSNALLRNCIHRLQSVPSMYMIVIGRAGDGAESTLNPQLFSEAVDADAFIQFDNPSLECPLQMMADELSAVIVCAVAVVDSSIDLDDLNCDMRNESYMDAMEHPPLCYGGWVITDQERIKSYAHHDFSDFDERRENILAEYGIWKKGCMVMVKKGEEWKTLRVLKTIIDRLHED